VPRSEINLPFIHKDKNFSHVLTKEKFEELIAPMVEKTVQPCLSALKVRAFSLFLYIYIQHLFTFLNIQDAKIGKVDNVILVGGMANSFEVFLFKRSSLNLFT